MRRALGELDQNTPVALRRSPRACVARVGAETPSRARVETVESVEPQTTTRQHNAAALDAAVALLRERNVESPRPSDPGHLTYKDALTKAGYRGDNGVVVLSKRLGAEKRRVDADSAANVLIDMRQLSVIEGEVVERGEEVIEERPEQPIPGRKGRSGRPQMTDEERERAELARRSVHGYPTQGDYAVAVCSAVQLIRQEPVGTKTALARTLIESEFSRTGAPSLTPKYLVSLASDEDFSELRRRGGPLLTCSEETMLADRVRRRRQHFLAVRPREVTGWANGILEKCPERWARTNSEGLTTGWYPGFAKRNGFKMVTKKNLDVVRARWSTAENVSKFYDLLYAGALALGAAEAVANATLEREGNSMLNILHPELWVSMDETSISLAPEATHSNGQRIISAGVGDQGETLHSKGLPRNTLVYARNGAGQLLPSMVVCGGRAKLPDDFQRVDLLATDSRRSEDAAAAVVPPNVVDAEGVPLKTHWTACKTASLSGDLLIQWAEVCLFPSLRVVGLSAERPAILLYDGVQTHVSLEFIELCAEQNVHVFLRTPHTTALLQGEDTVIFP